MSLEAVPLTDLFTAGVSMLASNMLLVVFVILGVVMAFGFASYVIKLLIGFLRGAF